MKQDTMRGIDRRAGLPSLRYIWLPIGPLDSFIKDRHIRIKSMDANMVRAYMRARSKGRLTEGMADEIACALGYHPCEIWEEW